LGSLPLLGRGRTRSISAENPTGEKGKGGMASAIGKGWSGDAQLFVRTRKVGDFVELAIPAKEAGARKVVLYATRASDYGMLRFTVNGKPAEVKFDGYAAKPAPTGPINLGAHEPKDGQFVLRAEVVGTNPPSTGPKYYFGLDAVVLDRP
jgi:hypothetical protein